MTDREPAESDGSPRRGVPRRAVLGGALGAAAAGIVGYEVGSANASTTDQEGTAADASLAEASAVTVVPEGELIADDVQAALVDVYGRTSALARLEDLRVAYELVDDFPPTAGGGRVGSLGWAAVRSGPGAAVGPGAPTEGGVVRLATGTSANGRAGLHLGLTQHSGAPVFTMQWRLRFEAEPDPAQPATVAFGALASVSDDPASSRIGPALVWVHDPETSPNWLCRVVQGGEVVDVDSKQAVDRAMHRFTITSDGEGVARFTFDDEEAVAVPVDAEDEARYGQGLVVAKTSGNASVGVAVDWFYLRRELPR